MKDWEVNKGNVLDKEQQEEIFIEQKQGFACLECGNTPGQLEWILFPEEKRARMSQHPWTDEAEREWYPDIQCQEALGIHLYHMICGVAESFITRKINYS